MISNTYCDGNSSCFFIALFIDASESLKGPTSQQAGYCANTHTQTQNKEK